MIDEPISRDMEWALKQFACGAGMTVRARTVDALERRDLIWYPDKGRVPQLTERGRRHAKILLAPKMARYE